MKILFSPSSPPSHPSRSLPTWPAIFQLDFRQSARVNGEPGAQAEVPIDPVHSKTEWRRKVEDIYEEESENDEELQVFEAKESG